MRFDDFEHNSKWKLIFNNLELYYPDTVEQMRSWYASGDWEITIKLTDGTRWIFDGRENLLYRLKDDKNISQEEYTQEFARRLYRKMRDAGIGTEELADRIGVSRRTFSRYLNGHTVPNGYVLTRIASVLQCSINDLLDIWERR